MSILAALIGERRDERLRMCELLADVQDEGEADIYQMRIRCSSCKNIPPLSAGRYAWYQGSRLRTIQTR